MTARAGVFLHGFTGSPASWEPVRAWLPPEQSVIAPALIGHGDAADAPSSTWDDELDRLAGFLPERDYHLIGYSLGARLALGLLVRLSHRFVRATLIGVNPGLDDPAERRERRDADERWCRLLEERGVEAFVEAWEALPLFASQTRSPEARASQRATRRAHTAAGLVRSLRVTGLAAMPTYWPLLDGIETPVDLVVGREDAKFRRIAERARARLRGARLYVVSGAGHNVVLERPDAIAHIVQDRPPEGAL